MNKTVHIQIRRVIHKTVPIVRNAFTRAIDAQVGTATVNEPTLRPKTVDVEIARLTHKTVSVVQNAFTREIDTQSEPVAADQPKNAPGTKKTSNKTPLDLQAMGATAARLIGGGALAMGGWILLKTLTKRFHA